MTAERGRQAGGCKEGATRDNTKTSWGEREANGRWLVLILVLVRTFVRVFLLTSIHVHDPPYPLHQPPSTFIDFSRSPASTAVLRAPTRRITGSHARHVCTRAPPTAVLLRRWLSLLGGRTKMARLWHCLSVAAMAGITNDGGRDRSSNERHLTPTGCPSKTMASVDDGLGGQKY